jgi:hypothetical protein
VPYLYTHYGPGGDNTIWVAPSENIFSYVVTQHHASVSATAVSISASAAPRRIAVSGAGKAEKTLIKAELLRRGIAPSTARMYGLRGERIHSGSFAQGLHIVMNTELP